MKRGDLIRKRRKQLNLTQQDFSKKVHISKSFISDIENNKKMPSLESFDLILKTLEISHVDFYRQLDQVNDKSGVYSVYRDELLKELSLLVPSITSDWSTDEIMELVSYIKVKQSSK